MVELNERAEMIADLRRYWPTQIEILAAATQLEEDGESLASAQREVAALRERLGKADSVRRLMRELAESPLTLDHAKAVYRSCVTMLDAALTTTAQGEPK